AEDRDLCTHPPPPHRRAQQPLARPFARFLDRKRHCLRSIGAVHRRRRQLQDFHLVSEPAHPDYVARRHHRQRLQRLGKPPPRHWAVPAKRRPRPHPPRLLHKPPPTPT